MKQERENNNYLNENYILLESDDNIKEMDSRFNEIGLISNSQQITEKEYWYELHDIFNILKAKIDTKTVNIVLPEPLLWDEKNKQSLKQTLSLECAKLKNSNNKKATVVPVNLGNSHWTSLIITKDQEGGLIFNYNNPDGTPINRNLKEMLEQLDPTAPIIDFVTKQQWNDYDCGAITIDNLVKIVNGEPIKSNLDKNSSENYAAQLRKEHAELITMQQQIERDQKQNLPEVEQPNQQNIPIETTETTYQKERQKANSLEKQDVNQPDNPSRKQEEKGTDNKIGQFFSNIGNKISQIVSNTPNKISSFFNVIAKRFVQSINDTVDKIKKNPIKSAVIGAGMLFTLPYSVLAAGVVLVGKTVKDVIVPPKQTIKNPQNLQQQNKQQNQEQKNESKQQQQQNQQRQQYQNFRKNTSIKPQNFSPAPPVRPNIRKNNNQLSH